MLELRIHRSILDFEPAAWNALAGTQPFLRHAFLSALETSGSLSAELGWRAHHAGLYRGGALVAAAPAYAKTNSHGEFVFDHAWSDAYRRYGLAYFPKLLVAVPYSPVPGLRLLVADDEHAAATRSAFATALRHHVEGRGWSSAHVNFVDASSADALSADGWLERRDVQFHWRNRGYENFDAFLGALKSKRRKEIRRERAAFAASEWQFDWLDGHALGEDDLAFVYACYAQTFEDKGNYPALTPEFFSTIARALPDAVRVLVARASGERVAMAFCLVDARRALYGRYWGALRTVPGLHFECCYYRGIAYCIEQGIERFEPGAQGEHKLARGFLPVLTHSRHYIAEPAMREAIAHSLVRERAWVEQYRRSLAAHSPYAERDV